MIYSASLRSSSMVATARTTRETSITAMIHMAAAPIEKVIDCSAGGSEGCGCRFEQIWEVALDAGMNLGADCDDAVASVLLLRSGHPVSCHPTLAVGGRNRISPRFGAGRH